MFHGVVKKQSRTSKMCMITTHMMKMWLIDSKMYLIPTKSYKHVPIGTCDDANDGLFIILLKKTLSLYLVNKISKEF